MGKMLVGGQLEAQNKEMAQRISLRNVVFKTREVKLFIVFTHLLGTGPNGQLEKVQRKTARITRF